MAGAFSIDASDFKRFSRSLRAAAPEVEKKMRTKLRAGGVLIANEIKAKASESSSTIPGQIKVRMAAGVVTITASGLLASLFELGNASGGGGGTFRHPVYGNQDVWVDQPMHPFFYKTVDDKADDFAELLGEAIDEVFALVLEDSEV